MQEFDVVAITDEIYEHILYDGEHIPIASLPGMRERTVMINGLSKTYSVTGWRVGWVIAPAGPDGRHPQGPRLPDRRRRRSAPGRRDRALALPDAYYAALAEGTAGAATLCWRRSRCGFAPGARTAPTT